MRAFTLDSFESAPGFREDLPIPTADADELLVRVHASSVNSADAAIAAGMLKGMAEYEFPVTLGRDFAGVVEEVGPAVGRYAAGDRVYGFVLHANPTVHDGSWADYAVIPRDSVARAPESVELATVGAAPLAALTALAALDALELSSRESVLVVGRPEVSAAFSFSLPQHEVHRSSLPRSPRTASTCANWAPARSWIAIPTSSPTSASASRKVWTLFSTSSPSRRTHPCSRRADGSHHRSVPRARGPAGRTSWHPGRRRISSASRNFWKRVPYASTSKRHIRSTKQARRCNRSRVPTLRGSSRSR